MANFYGSNATNILNTNPTAKAGVGEQGGLMKIAYDSITFTTDLTTSDTLYLMKLPKGARLLDCVAKFSDLGSTGLFNIGWQAGATGAETANASGFFSSLDVKTAADVLSARDNAASPAFMHKQLLEEVQVVVVPSESTNSATSGTFSLHVEYIID
jgi:hypothetical protein